MECRTGFLTSFRPWLVPIHSWYILDEVYMLILAKNTFAALGSMYKRCKKNQSYLDFKFENKLLLADEGFFASETMSEATASQMKYLVKLMAGCVATVKFISP
jgi:hypothetical protein